MGSLMITVTSTSSPSTTGPSTGTALCSCARGIVTCLLLCLWFLTLWTLGLSWVEASSTDDGVEGLMGSGSTVNKSSLACVASSVDDKRLKGWAGRQIPSRTGASIASATWTSSGMAMVERHWKMRWHFIKGWTTPLLTSEKKPASKTLQGGKVDLWPFGAIEYHRIPHNARFRSDK